MKDNPQPAKCRRYDAAFRAEALRLASESCSAQAAAHALYIDPRRIYKWQMKALTPVVAGTGTGNFKKSNRNLLVDTGQEADKETRAYY